MVLLFKTAASPAGRHGSVIHFWALQGEVSMLQVACCRIASNGYVAVCFSLKLIIMQFPFFESLD